MGTSLTLTSHVSFFTPNGRVARAPKSGFDPDGFGAAGHAPPAPERATRAAALAGGTANSTTHQSFHRDSNFTRVNVGSVTSTRQHVE
jgi:hypothetical protein